MFIKKLLLVFISLLVAFVAYANLKVIRYQDFSGNMLVNARNINYLNLKLLVLMSFRC